MKNAEIIKLKTSTIAAAAKAAGVPAAKFVAEIRSISLGREMCAHFEREEGEMSIFSVFNVRTLSA
jgi:hypothetical protein